MAIEIDFDAVRHIYRGLEWGEVGILKERLCDVRANDMRRFANRNAWYHLVKYDRDWLESIVHVTTGAKKNPCVDPNVLVDLLMMLPHILVRTLRTILVIGESDPLYAVKTLTGVTSLTEEDTGIGMSDSTIVGYVPSKGGIVIVNIDAAMNCVAARQNLIGEGETFEEAAKRYFYKNLIHLLIDHMVQNDIFFDAGDFPYYEELDTDEWVKRTYEFFLESREQNTKEQS